LHISPASIVGVIHELPLLYNGGSTLIRPVDVVNEIVLVVPLVFVRVKLPVDAVELGLNKNLLPGGNDVNSIPVGSVCCAPSTTHPAVV